MKHKASSNPIGIYNEWFLRNFHDIVFSGGALVFFLALLPLAMQTSNNIPRLTSLSTAGVLGLYAVNSASMRLWFYTAANLAMAYLWLMVYQNGGA